MDCLEPPSRPEDGPSVSASRSPSQLVDLPLALLHTVRARDGAIRGCCLVCFSGLRAHAHAMSACSADVSRDGPSEGLEACAVLHLGTS
jgi:hypothetical protein